MCASCIKSRSRPRQPLYRRPPSLFFSFSLFLTFSLTLSRRRHVYNLRVFLFINLRDNGRRRTLPSGGNSPAVTGISQISAGSDSGTNSHVVAHATMLSRGPRLIGTSSIEFPTYRTPSPSIIAA